MMGMNLRPKARLSNERETSVRYHLCEAPEGPVPGKWYRTLISRSILKTIGEIALLVALFFVVAGVAPPAVNEAHYLAKSKNYWESTWCASDIFVTSGNPHLLFHFTFGALTQFFSLEATAWIGRFIGWTMIAVGLRSLTRAMTEASLAPLCVAIVWIAGVKNFNLAGEWVIGGVEGKVPAYGLLLFALRWMIDGKWKWVWPALGLASGFHVLVGGWSALVALCIYLRYGREQASFGSQLFPLALGGLISLFGVYPALSLTTGMDPKTVDEAAKIYSFERLSHHLAPSGLELIWYLRHGLILLLFAGVSWKLRNDRLFLIVQRFTTGMVLIAAAGLFVGGLQTIAPELTARLLRYYWFRMTDSIVPLALALAWARFPTAGFRTPIVNSTRALVLMVAIVLVAIEAKQASDMTVVTVSGKVVSAIGMNAAPNDRKRVLSDWVAVCDWVDRTLPKDEMLLTPRNQQSFKWYSNRAEVVNWKDMPQDSVRMVEWSRRFFDVFPRRLGTVRVTVRYPDLIRFRQEYGARFMVVDRRYSGASLPLVQVYPLAPYEINATYAVYRLP